MHSLQTMPLKVLKEDLEIFKQDFKKAARVANKSSTLHEEKIESMRLEEIDEETIIDYFKNTYRPEHDPLSNKALAYGFIMEILDTEIERRERQNDS